jgi:hypothetical protein
MSAGDLNSYQHSSSMTVGSTSSIRNYRAVSLARWGYSTRAYLHNREPSVYF